MEKQLPSKALRPFHNLFTVESNGAVRCSFRFFYRGRRCGVHYYVRESYGAVPVRYCPRKIVQLLN